VERGRTASEKATAKYYALVVPGLEEIAAAELRSAGARVVVVLSRIDKRDGMVLFDAPDLSRVMSCGTIEDVYAVVLDAPTGGGRGAPGRLARSLERGLLERALSAHHALRPGKRGRSYRVVARVAGAHPFRREEVEAAFAKRLDALLGKWVPAREGAALELWVHVVGERTIAGVRLSDDTLAGRRYKRAHVPASLKPTVARALAIMAEVRAGDVVVDPMCGAGTVVREAAEQQRAHSKGQSSGSCVGGDVDAAAIEAARVNVGRAGELAVWDARRLPLRDGCVDIVISNPPYGRQHEAVAGLGKLYRAAMREAARVLRPGGRCVVLTGEPSTLLEALPKALRVRSKRRLLLRGLPVMAVVMVRG
jgi:23S rRNA G2445 N2-methylase RlmL